MDETARVRLISGIIAIVLLMCIILRRRRRARHETTFTPVESTPETVHTWAARKCNESLIAYHHHKNTREASEILEGAIRVLEREDPQSRELAPCKNQLARLYGCQNKPGEALALARASIALAEEQGGHPASLLREMQATLVPGLCALGRYRECIERCQRQLVDLEELHGTDSTEVTRLTSYFKTVKSVATLNRGLFAESDADISQLLLETFPERPYALHNLGWLRMEQGRLAEAEELLGQALEVMLGNKDIEAYCARTRGILRRRAGKLQEAEQLARHSLRLWETQEFRNELEIAFVERNLGEIRFEQGNLEEAFEYLSRAVQRIEEHVSRDHPKLGGVYSRLAAVQAAKGKRQEALDLAVRAIGIMSIELTEADSDVTACRALLATLERA